MGSQLRIQKTVNSRSHLDVSVRLTLATPFIDYFFVQLLWLHPVFCMETRGFFYQTISYAISETFLYFGTLFITIQTFLIIDTFLIQFLLLFFYINRENCFSNEYFNGCVEALLLQEELHKFDKWRDLLGRKWKWETMTSRNPPEWFFSC